MCPRPVGKDPDLSDLIPWVCPDLRVHAGCPHISATLPPSLPWGSARHSQPECPQKFQLVCLASWCGPQMGLVGYRRTTVKSKVGIPHIPLYAGIMRVLERPRAAATSL